jgi:hypothetical protein
VPTPTAAGHGTPAAAAAAATMLDTPVCLT